MRIRALALVVMVGCAVWPGWSQKRVPATSGKLSMEFSTQALKALRLIAESRDARGRDVLEAVGAADDAARTAGEQSAVTLLREFAEAKAKNRDGYKQELDSAWLAWELHHDEPAKASEDASLQDQIAADGNRERYAKDKAAARQRIEAAVAGRGVIQEMAQRQAACQVAAETMLRGGVYRAVPACSNVYVSVAEDMTLR